ncbi:MAG: 50S ribosomal protein L22 [Rickettsiales bacterium]|nr:50S ribosomal protein L22 [Rickettsiales bacterium]
MTKAKRKLSENQASAKLSNIKTSVQKLNIVADLIRGMKADQAVLQLQFMKKKLALPVKKCLESALANAENNHELDIDNLVIDRVLVGKSFVMKRFRARARGRGAKILKPFSNIEIIVKEIEG